jgi:predicted MFS family arabinose efflux permease
MFAEKMLSRTLYSIIWLNILACLLFKFFPKLPFFSVLALAVWSCVAFAAWLKPVKIVDHAK